MVGRLRDLQVLGDLGHLAALGQQPVGLPELADDLLGVCRRRFIESSWPCWAVRTLTGSPSLLATRTTVGRSVWFLSGDGQGLVPLDGQYELRRLRAGRGLVTAFRETPHRGPNSEHAARASTPGQARRPHPGRGRRGRRPGDPSAPVRVRIPAGAVRAVRSDLRFDYGHLPLVARPMRSAPRREARGCSTTAHRVSAGACRPGPWSGASGPGRSGRSPAAARSAARGSRRGRAGWWRSRPPAGLPARARPGPTVAAPAGRRRRRPPARPPHTAATARRRWWRTGPPALASR